MTDRDERNENAMSDRWTDRLSEYLDGDLEPRTRAELETHLESCVDCRDVLEDLRALVVRAEALEDRTPAADLWPGIARRIEVERVGAWSRFSGWLGGARIALTIPQLAAAAALLMFVSAGSAWLVGRPAVPVSPGAPRVFQAGDPTPGAAETVAESPAPTGNAPGVTNPPLASASSGRRTGPVMVQAASADGDFDRYDSAIAELESVLRAYRTQLDPATVAVLEENLALVDRAIGDARRALAADPASAYLNGYLAQQLQRKVQVLRQAADIVAVHEG